MEEDQSLLRRTWEEHKGGLVILLVFPLIPLFYLAQDIVAWGVILLMLIGFAYNFGAALLRIVRAVFQSITGRK